MAEPNWLIESALDPAAHILTAIPDGPAVLVPLSELGSGTAGPSIVQVARNSATQTNSSTNNNQMTAIDGLTATLVAGHRYHVRAVIPFRTAATTTGIGFRLDGPAMSVYAVKLSAQQGAAGTDQTYENTGTVLATPLVSTGATAANATLLAVIEAVAEPSADGTLTVQFRSEVNGSVVSVMDGAVMIVTDCG